MKEKEQHSSREEERVRDTVKNGSCLKKHIKFRFSHHTAKRVLVNDLCVRGNEMQTRVLIHYREERLAQHKSH